MLLLFRIFYVFYLLACALAGITKLIALNAIKANKKYEIPGGLQSQSIVYGFATILCLWCTVYGALSFYVVINNPEISKKVPLFCTSHELPSDIKFACDARLVDYVLAWIFFIVFFIMCCGTKHDVVEVEVLHHENRDVSENRDLDVEKAQQNEKNDSKNVTTTSSLLKELYTQLNDITNDVMRGGLFEPIPHCIAHKLHKADVKKILTHFERNHDESVIFQIPEVSSDWIDNITHNLAITLKTTPEKLKNYGTKIANIISTIGHGTWTGGGGGITSLNVIRDIHINFPLYISDYFDQLHGWSRENSFDQHEFHRIGSKFELLKGSNKPYPPQNPWGPETALSGKFVKFHWNLPELDVHCHFTFDPKHKKPSFMQNNDAKIGEVYRYFAFIDFYKQALIFNDDGKIEKQIYDFTNSAQLWRIENYGKFYALYNKKYEFYLTIQSEKLGQTKKKPENNWSPSALLLIENPETNTYSIGSTRNNVDIEFPNILKDLTLVTIPLVAWKNHKNKFVTITDQSNGTLGFEKASRLTQALITKKPPSPGKGARFRVWKADPSVKKIGIRELYLPITDITDGPSDSWFEIEPNIPPISPDENGDFLLDFDDSIPSTIPPSLSHAKFDAVHTFAICRYVFNLLFNDIEYLDGKPPKLERPWTNAFYSKVDSNIRFYYVKNKKDEPIYLCRSLDIVAHETGHAFLDILQTNWLVTGQTGALHEAFGDLCSMFTILSMDDMVSLLITTTKSSLRTANNFLAAIGEEFGDFLYDNHGKGLRNLSNDLKGSTAGNEIHNLSLVFSGFVYDVLVDIFNMERNPLIKSDAQTLMDVSTNLRRALIIAIRVSSIEPTENKFQELATNLEISVGTLGRRLGVDLSKWKKIIQYNSLKRELAIAGQS
ncbi:3868_t:CDS:10 [Diversispora eburnea]|uniref:3868_t:CDS:1 n=1 Tax=Diversispora eburnea TaxID=1213867 RepID=A0A9N8Z0B1_9GLOM|nr:3868_t:CDS:10 [Diversispora eburnea]